MPDEQSQLLRGALRLLLLELVSRGETYGYEVLVALHERGLTNAAEGTVYPALQRLEREGLLASRLEASSRGAARKYYRLTDDGEAARLRVREAWRDLVDVVEATISTEEEHADAPA